MLRTRPLLVVTLVLFSHPSCETNHPTPPTLWYRTCGDPVCGPPRPQPGIPACSVEIPGQTCTQPGAVCNPMEFCNSLIVCASSDPQQPPGVCPVSRARFKRDIAYLGEADLLRLHAELRRIPLATYRYREAGPGDHLHLGFVIEDVEPSLAVDGSGDRVDLYAYASMTVAALQVQAKQIESLQRDVATLRQELARRPPRR